MSISVIFSVLVACLACLVSPVVPQQCIRFEFHEKLDSTFDQSDLIKAMCLGKGGNVVDYSLQLIYTSGPLIFNVTYHCWAPSPCLSDHDCPVNFNCANGLCTVATGCPLTDEPEIVLQEGRDCFIDDDCYFETPFDSQNWKCLPDPWCFHNKTCSASYNFCKRCPTGYIDADPKRFAAADGSIRQPTTSAPWWLTAQPTTASPLSLTSPNSIEGNSDINRLYNPTERPFVHLDPSVASLPDPLSTRTTESPFDRFTSFRAVTPSTTPDPITVGYDELSPNNDNNRSIESSTENDTNNETAIRSIYDGGFAASDLPVALSDDELITNMTGVDLARIEPTDFSDDTINNTESSSPQPIDGETSSPLPDIPSTSFFPSPSSSPLPSSQPSQPSFPPLPRSTSSSSSSPFGLSFSFPSLLNPPPFPFLINFASRPPTPLVTANPFAWPGFLENDLNRTVVHRTNNNINSSSDSASNNNNNITDLERRTTTTPNFTEINYI